MMTSATLGHMPEKKPVKKRAPQSTKGTTVAGKTAKRFTDDERAAMRERAKELKTEVRGPRGDKGSEESAVLAKIAEMAAADRAMGERLHAIIIANVPDLAPRLWYGMPAYAKDGAV